MPLIFFLLLLALAAHAQQERVAIIQTLDDRDSLGIPDLVYLTDKLRETASNILPKPRYGVMTTESIVAFLGSEEQAVKICRESSCLAELGRKVNADYVAQARIGRFDGDLTIKTELYSSKSGIMVGSFTGDSKSLQGLRIIIDEKAPILFKKLPGAADVSAMPPPPPQQEPQQVQYQPLQQQGANMDPRAKVQWYINKGIDEYKEDIQKESSSLSYIDKTNLYDENKKSTLGYLVLNFAPGFGLGSYIQGDIKSGVILSIADVVGLIIISKGVNASNDDDMMRSDMGIFTGAAVLFVSRVMGCIYPYSYAEKYNKLLNEALNINNNISYSIDPLIVPRDGMPAVGLAFNGRF